MVEYAVEKSWETIADLNFVFSPSACGNTDKGVRIKITDDSKVKACGDNQPNPGRPGTCYKWGANGAELAKMHLNFTFENFKGAMSPVAVNPVERKKQVNRMIFHYAIHEFGHAIGFLHETDRIKGKEQAGAFFCDDDDGENSIGGVEVAYYDVESVMHYRCNNAGNWRNGPPTTLSCGDMIAARWMFGDKNTHINPNCVAAKAINKDLPKTISAGYAVPRGGYDLGDGADVYEPTTTPVYAPISTNNWGFSAMHQAPNKSRYIPTHEPKVSLAISPETQTVSGSPRKGYRITVNFAIVEPNISWIDPSQVWVQELTLETVAGPVTVYRDNANAADNKPDWAYPQANEFDLPYYCVRTAASDRNASMDKNEWMQTPKLTKSNPSWSIWVPKGQGVYRDAQDNYGFFFSPPLPAVRVQSANESGLYFADMEFYSVNARIAYWDNAWYESINIKGALPKDSDAIRFFIDKKEIVSKSALMGNPYSPTRFIQVDKTEITFPDYFFVTSNRIPNSSTMLDLAKARKPIGQVTWFDAIVYCNLRSELEGLQKVYSYSNPVYGSPNTQWSGKCIGMSNLNADLKKNGYRLPTEDEWKHLYSAQIGSEYFWSSYEDPNAYAWFGTQTSYTRDVGLKVPNSKGLFDMAGNSAEWIWAGEFGNTEVDTKALLKGGSVGQPESSLGKSNRLARYKHDHDPAHTFRVVRSRPNPLIPSLNLLLLQ